jgi:hypothetical protein
VVYPHDESYKPPAGGKTSIFPTWDSFEDACSEFKAITGYIPTTDEVVGFYIGKQAANA